MKKHSLRFLTLTLIGILIYSCQNDDFLTPENPDSNLAENIGIRSGDKTVLGKQLGNPYDISNMKQAFKNITKKKVSGRFAMRKTVDQEGDTLEYIEIPEELIRITHKYIKFIPKNEEELDALKKDSTLVLFDFPLDYEIDKEGDYYHDPNVADSIPTPQYTTIKLSQKITDTIQYELLSELYLPEEDAVLDPEILDDPNNDQAVTLEETTNPANGVSSKMASSSAKQALRSLANDNHKESKLAFSDNLLEEAFRITGNELDLEEDSKEEISNGVLARWWRRSKWTPQGTIQTYDDRLRRNIALEGVTVKGWRWFTRRSAITNSSGYYRMGRVRKKYFKYRIAFERYHFKIIDVGTFVGDVIRWIRGRSAAEVYLGKHRRRGVNKIITSKHNRYLADIFRGAYYYYYKNIDGLRRPPLNRWWKPQMKISASETNDASSHVHQRRWIPIVGSQIILKEYGERSDQVVGTTIHELAHASHWNMDRANYNRIVWKGYIDPTIAHGGDLNPDNKRARRLLETWATTVEIYLTRKYYRENYWSSYRYSGDDLQRQLISGNDTRDFYTTCGYDMIDNE